MTMIEKRAYKTAQKSNKLNWICPRCKVLIDIKQYPAISRRDNQTEICSSCGTEEAMFDFNMQQKDQEKEKYLMKSMRKIESEWMGKNNENL